MNSKLIGGILLIIGTSIGGGMLALPVATAEMGFVNSVIFLVACWLVMTVGALLVLEVNLRLPAGSNMVSMAKATLGLPGQIIAWVTYLFLLYTLLAAYISGGSDVFAAVLTAAHLTLSDQWSAFVFTLLFGLIVYGGIRTVDIVNRGLMFGKLSVFLLLLLVISPHMHLTMLSHGHVKVVSGSLMILITSFGFASIVPSLREYFHDDVAMLRKAIILGSLVPLFCYIAWVAVIMGTVSSDGPMGLIQLATSDHAASGLTTALSQAVNSQWIHNFFSFFSSVCMLTAFLGVSMGLFDFLADGLSLKKSGREGKWVLLLTFFPPLLIVLSNPSIYLQALRYAGICCVILLLLLPSIMAWRGRIRADGSQILVPGGTMVLGASSIAALYLLYSQIY